MTLVVVGHQFAEFGMAASAALGIVGSQRWKPDGVFAVADSSITTLGSNGLKTILGGFRKVYPVSVKVWKPSFVDVYFRSYQQVHFEAECLLAIAGSTLTAQHALNFVTEHLANLRISYERGGVGYVIKRHCESNVLEEGAGIDQWDEDMFTPDDYANLISGGEIAKVVEHSINRALSSARKYKLDAASFASMRTDFAFGIYCPVAKQHELYVFRTKSRQNKDGILEVYAEREEIAPGDVGVLGMRTEFEQKAKIAMKDIMDKHGKPAEGMFEFLNECIDEVKAKGSFEIDRPSVCKLLFKGSVNRFKFRAE